MRGIAWIAAAVCLVTGCFETPQAVLDDVVCEQVCNCFIVVDCESACLSAVAPVSQECFDVVSANAQDCSIVAQALQEGGACRQDLPDIGPEPE